MLVLLVTVIVVVIGFIVFKYSGVMASNNTVVGSLGSGVIRLRSFDVDDLIERFSHSKIVFSQTYSNGTSRSSYITIDRLGLEEIDGIPVYRVKLEAVSSDNKSVAFIWITRDFSKILLFRSGGIEYTNETAEYYGRMVLSAPSFVLTAMQMSVLFDINVSEGKVYATALHWNITSFNESTIKLGDKAYKAVMGEAVKYANSTIDRRVWFKAVYMDGAWYLLYVKVAEQDGVYTISIEELS